MSKKRKTQRTKKIWKKRLKFVKYICKIDVKYVKYIITDINNSEMRQIGETQLKTKL